MKRGLSKKKIVAFVRSKLGKKKVIYKKYSKRGKKGKKSARDAQDQTGPLNINKIVTDQIEEQALRLSKPSESELFRQPRESLIIMAKNLGAKNPYRKTKLQLIDDIVELSKTSNVDFIKDSNAKIIKQELIDRGISIEQNRIVRKNLPLFIEKNEKRLGRALTEPEIKKLRLKVEQKVMSKYTKNLDFDNMPYIDQKRYIDIARGLTREEIQRKYGDELDEKHVDDKKETEVRPSEPSGSAEQRNRPEETETKETDEFILTAEELKNIEELEKEYRNRNRIDNYEKDMEELQRLYGNGKQCASVDNNDALTNIQIDKIMKPYGPMWLGSCACDTIERDILHKVKPKSKGCFVVNTDKDKGPGEHWCSVYFDATPKGSHSIEFFDSYGEDPDKPIDAGLKKLAHKLACNNYLKYKINSVCWQGKKDGTNKESSNCGYFAVKFLIDRLRGKSFQESTCYDASKEGEKNIEKFKTGEGIQKEMLGCARAHMGFGILPSFTTIPTSLPDVISHPITQRVLKYVFTPSRELSNAFKNVMSKYGNMRVLNATIRRAPISSTLNSLMNLISFGKFDQFKKEKNFDKFFHLGIVLQLANGKRLLLEKNAKPEFSESFTDTKDTQYKGPVRVKGNPTLNEFIQRTIDKNSIYKFTNYDALDNNCQKFILMLLEANDSLTPDLKNFIYQDITGIVQRLPSFVDKISRGATDIAAVAQSLIGRGRSLKKATLFKQKFTTKRRKAIKKLFKSFNIPT